MQKTYLRYLTHLIDEQGCARNTFLAYKADLEQFMNVSVAQAGGMPTGDMFHPDSISKYVQWLSKQGYRPATIGRKIAALRSFLDYLKTHEGMRDIQLGEALHLPSTPRRKPRILSQEELRSLLQAPEKTDHPRARRDHSILTLLYATGLRVAEVTNLQLRDIDLKAGNVRSQPSRNSHIPLGMAAETMQRYLKDGRPHLVKNPDEEALYLNQRGMRLSRQGLWLVVKRWASKVDLEQEISPHTFRHTLAQDLLNQGKTRREVQEFLGLSSPNALWVKRGKP